MQLHQDQTIKAAHQDTIGIESIDRAKEQILEDEALKMTLQNPIVIESIDRAKEQILEDEALKMTLQDPIGIESIDQAKEQIRRDQEVILDQSPIAIVSHVHSDLAANLKKKDQVFIVHGRDDSAKIVVYQFLKKLGLEPIILHEQPNKGRTLIEKFEDHSSNVKYAVVLLTPDDLGGLATEPNKTLPRARQNVVFEMGYFFGRFGRENVCALLSSGVERPSDIDGVMYIPLSQNGEWKSSLLRELKDAGLVV